MAYRGSDIASFFNPKPIYGDRTSKEGEFRQTGSQSVQHSFPAKGGAQTRSVQVPYYTWFPKAEAAPAEAPASTNTQTKSSVPDFIKKYVNSGSTTTAGLTAVKEAMRQGMSIADIRNASRDQGFSFGSGAQSYLDQQQSGTTATALPDFISTYVNPDYYVEGGGTRAGLTAVQKAQAAGMSINDILRASVAQGFQFGSGAQTYLDNARAAAPTPTPQPDYQSQIADLARQQESYLNNLRIEQDNRLNAMAVEQQKRADELATGQRTYQQNQARANQMGALQIAGSSQTPRTGGTQGFKRRALQINPVTANALEGILGGTKAAATTNTLNV